MPARSCLGTSHRQAPVKNLVREIQEGLKTFFNAPADYEVVLGVGGSTAFWDIAAFGLVRNKAQHLSFGEFGSKFAAATNKAPFLRASSIIVSEPGTRPVPVAEAGVDVYAWPQNETSTGVAAPVHRVEGADEGSLVLIDATSAAGGLDVDVSQADVYYFAPQKNFASDGGLWIALFSPAAIARAEEIAASGPLDPRLPEPEDGHRQLAPEPDLQHPGTVHPGHPQRPGAVAQRQRRPGLRRRHAPPTRPPASTPGPRPPIVATPYVAAPEDRSNVIATIDFDDSIDAAAVAKTLRANGVVDVEPYRKLGRNQLRIATFVAIEPEDVSALLRASSTC